MPEALSNFIKASGLAMVLMGVGLLVLVGYYVFIVVVGRMLDARDKKLGRTRDSDSDRDRRFGG